jgi:Tol biopolymer transport system component
MNKQTSNQLLDELARESLGQDINLSSDLMIKVRKEKNKTMKKRTLITTLIAIVMVVAILASVPSVVQAVKNLLGFIPGVGFVEQSTPLRILKESVDTNIDETKITVSQAVTDSDHLRLFYQVENIPTVDTATAQQRDVCQTLPQLKLTDGTVLEAGTISGNFWGSGYSRQLEFAALPVEENSAVLVLPCLEGSLSKDGIKDIEIALSFVKAPADMKVYPIVDLPTPTAEINPKAAVSTADHISLVIDKYVQTDGQIILMGALFSDSQEVGLSLVESQDIHLVDAAGQKVVISEDDTLPDPETARSPQLMPLTYKTAGPFAAGKAKLVIDQMWIERPSNVSFSFDPGANPQPGQTWTLNKTLEVGGHAITIQDVTKDLNGDGLMFNYESEEDVTNVSLMDLDHPMLGGGGGGSNTGFTYRDGFPNGVITITLTSYDERITGPWEATIDLPAFTEGTAPTPLPEACLTQSSWAEALNSSNRDFPAGLGGHLILMDILPPDNYYHVMSAELPGNNPIDLGLGDAGSLSPDQKTVIYSTNDGLLVRDMASGETHLVSGTSRRDRGALWSPDGSLIAFSRGPASGLIGAAGSNELMIMNVDGSNQQKLLADNGSYIAQTWMPDGKNLIYTTSQADGVLVQSINIETGLVSLLTQVNYQNAGIAVSPDGKQIAYEAMLPGERYGVYVSNLDGSNARLIANADPIVVTVPQWSPDGKWLIMSVQDTSLSEYMPTLALVNVENCQIIPLTSLQGYVTSWR